MAMRQGRKESPEKVDSPARIVSPRPLGTADESLDPDLDPLLGPRRETAGCARSGARVDPRPASGAWPGGPTFLASEPGGPRCNVNNLYKGLAGGFDITVINILPVVWVVVLTGGRG